MHLDREGHLPEAQLQAVWKLLLCSQKQWESHLLLMQQEGRLVAYHEGKQGGKQWHLVPKQSHPVAKQCHPVAKQCHPIGKQEYRVGQLVELAGFWERILGVVIGDDSQFLYALLCHFTIIFINILLCMHLMEFVSTH